MRVGSPREQDEAGTSDGRPEDGTDGGVRPGDREGGRYAEVSLGLEHVRKCAGGDEVCNTGDRATAQSGQHGNSHEDRRDELPVDSGCGALCALHRESVSSPGALRLRPEAEVPCGEIVRRVGA